MATWMEWCGSNKRLAAPSIFKRKQSLRAADGVKRDRRLHITIIHLYTLLASQISLGIVLLVLLNRGALALGHMGKGRKDHEHASVKPFISLAKSNELFNIHMFCDS